MASPLDPAPGSPLELAGERSSGVTVVLPAPAGGTALLATLDRIAEQTLAPREILLVVTGDDPPRLREFLSRLALAPGRKQVLVEAGAGWAARANAALEQAAGEFAVLLDPGDLLEPAYLRQASAALTADPAAQLAVPWVRREGPLGDPELWAPSKIDLETLVADTWALPTPSLFRVARWRQLGGFDPALDPLALYEYGLRLLAAGGKSSLLESPLVVRRGRPESSERQRLDRRAHESAWAKVFERQRAVFEEHLEAALVERQRRLQTRAQRYHSALALRDAAVAELRELDAGIAAARAAAPAIDWGELRRSAPVSRDWGDDRGVALDRHYIESFLEAHQADVRGVVLEVQEDDFTRRFGGDRVTRSEVVDIEPGNARATVLADLRSTGLLSESYDCVILTQTLHVIAEMPAVLAELRRLLKPGGVLLATVPTASRVCVEYGPAGDFCRLTAAGARQLFETTFAREELEITSQGNLLSTVAFLHGFARHELEPDEYERRDPWYPLLIGVRAVKSNPASRHHRDRAAVEGSTPAALASSRTNVVAHEQERGAILLYHRVVTGAETGVPDPHGLALSLGEFLRQMAHLRERYCVLPLAEFAERLAAATLPARAVSLTFDDAYVDNLTVASPVLLDLELPATFFAVSAAVRSGEPFWWDRLAALVLGGEPLPNPLAVIVGDRQLSLPTATKAERLASYYSLHSLLVGASLEVCHAALDALSSCVPAPVRAVVFPRPMQGSELREMAQRRGHTIGAHGARHLALPALAEAAQRAEIEHGRLGLAEILGRPVDLFSYPYGATDGACASHARAAGFAVGVTCESRGAHRSDNPLLLPRLEIKPGQNFAALLRAACR